MFDERKEKKKKKKKEKKEKKNGGFEGTSIPSGKNGSVANNVSYTIGCSVFWADFMATGKWLRSVYFVF